MTHDDGAAGAELGKVLIDKAQRAICHAKRGAGKSCRESYGLDSWCTACVQQALAECLRSALREPGELESLEATISTLKEGADKIAGQGPDSLPILWRGKSIAYGVVLDCINNMRTNQHAAACASLREPQKEQSDVE